VLLEPPSQKIRPVSLSINADSPKTDASARKTALASLSTLLLLLLEDTLEGRRRRNSHNVIALLAV
jgi:hypothetical protein